jgi:HD superfamily phosphohydrolase
MLFSTVYHHHKVRAAECLFKSLIREIKIRGLDVNGRKFNDTADFLYLTDDDIYSLVNRPEFGLASRLASDLKYRNGIFPKGRWFYPLKL